MMILRHPGWIEQLYVFCVQKVQECNDGFNGELPSSSTRVFFRQGSEVPVALMKRNLISPQERCFLPLDVEMIDQLLTLDVFVFTCPLAYLQYESGEVVG